MDTPRLTTVALIGLCITLSACRKDIRTEPNSNNSATIAAEASAAHPIHPKWNAYLSKIKASAAASTKTDQRYRSFFNNPKNAAEPSECQVSVLNDIVQSYFDSFEFWDYVLFPDYTWINQLSAVTDRSKQFFGRRGQYTQLVTKNHRFLTSFWSLKSAIRVNGQHSETLDNRDKVADVFIQFTGASQEDGYYIADQIIEMNKESMVFPESPLLSFDGFATPDYLIVLGDGLIEALVATGVQDDVVIGGLLSHEWSHQVQFENAKKWYGFAVDAYPSTAAFTRQLELEADFFSAYYLTHKRGGTYNWKKVAEFNELFYNIGDCDYNASGHHGTPHQRRKAAQLGYTIANDTKPKGHILPANELHAIFVKNLADLIK